MSELITYWEYMRKAEETKNTLDAIPTASLQTITNTAQGAIKNPKNIMGVIVDGRIVGTVSKRYRLVQHKDAFAPIFNGLHQTATPYEFSLFQTDTKAMLNVFVDEIKENGSGIKLGFKAINSINGETAINYAMAANSITSTLEIVGYRLVCQNGMKIRVPLDQAEFMKLEKVERVRELIRMAAKILHLGTEEAIKQKMEAVQYVTEAISLLKEPIALMIQKAKNKMVTEQEIKLMVAKYIGKRMSKKIIERFAMEDQSLWGAYCAVTYISSHDCTIPTMNGLLNSSAIMLEEELFPKKKA